MQNPVQPAKPNHFCCKCNAYHALHYVLEITGHRHLCVECPRGRYFIAGPRNLPLPVVPSRKRTKLEAMARQPELL